MPRLFKNNPTYHQELTTQMLNNSYLKVLVYQRGGVKLTFYDFGERNSISYLQSENDTVIHHVNYYTLRSCTFSRLKADSNLTDPLLSYDDIIKVIDSSIDDMCFIDTSGRHRGAPLRNLSGKIKSAKDMNEFITLLNEHKKYEMHNMHEDKQTAAKQLDQDCISAELTTPVQDDPENQTFTPGCAIS